MSHMHLVELQGRLNGGREESLQNERSYIPGIKVSCTTRVQCWVLCTPQFPQLSRELKEYTLHPKCRWYRISGQKPWVASHLIEGC